MGQPVLVADKLRLDANPFVPGAKRERVGRPLQTALGEVIRQVALETPVVIVAGSAGTGKSLLADMAERTFADMGLSVRQIHRGDLLGSARDRCDVLLIDEADSITDAVLQSFQAGGDRPATTMILLCLPSSVRRLGSAADAVVVELTRLTLSDTRAYLLQRSTTTGLRDLFSPEALDLIVDASRGLPRTLWSIASLAYFSAAYDGSSQIGRQHVAGALASQMTIHKIEHGVAPAAYVDNPVVEMAIQGADAAPPADQPLPPLARPGTANGSKARRPLVALGRFAIMGIAFAASAALAVVIPALLISGKPAATATVNTPPVAVQNVPRRSAAVPADQTLNAAYSTVVDNGAHAPAPKSTDRADSDKEIATTSNPKPASPKASPNPRPVEQASVAKAAPVRAQPETAARSVNDAPKATPVEAKAGIDIGNQATISPEAVAAAEEAAKLAAAQQEAERARVAKETAEQVRAEVARIMAEQQEADRVKAAKEAAEQAQAAMMRAQIAKDAADRVNAAMRASRAAEQEAARAEAARQSTARSRRTFSNSLFGVRE